MRDIICAVCGKKIGRLDLYMHHEKGVVCCDCMLEHEYFLMDAVPPPSAKSRRTADAGRAGAWQLPLPFAG